MIVLAYAALVLVAWAVLAVALGLVVGKVIRRADCCPHQDLDDHFDGIPADCLSPVEIDRRAARIDTFL